MVNSICSFCRAISDFHIANSFILQKYCMYIGLLEITNGFDEVHRTWELGRTRFVLRFMKDNYLS